MVVVQLSLCIHAHTHTHTLTHTHTYTHTHTHRQTTQYKLQQCLLDCVSTLCVKLQVPTPDMESLAHSCIPYLHRDQPLGLQQTCQTCFKNLIAYDPDTIWLLLQQLCPELVATPTNEILKPYKFRSFPASDKYVDNVKVLLSHCV